MWLWSVACNASSVWVCREVQGNVEATSSTYDDTLTITRSSASRRVPSGIPETPKRADMSDCQDWPDWERWDEVTVAAHGQTLAPTDGRLSGGAPVSTHNMRRRVVRHCSSSSCSLSLACCQSLLINALFSTVLSVSCQACSPHPMRSRANRKSIPQISQLRSVDVTPGPLGPFRTRMIPVPLSLAAPSSQLSAAAAAVAPPLFLAFPLSSADARMLLM